MSLKPLLLPSTEILIVVADASTLRDGAPLAQTLFVRDIERYRRVRCAETRSISIFGRAIVRETLSRITGIEAHSLQFGEGAFGKPFCVQAPNVHFNTSHSSSTLAIAICSAAEVGIDVEDISSRCFATELFPRCFTQAEVAALAAMSHDVWPEYLLACWTRKEAIAKACGTGLSEPREIETGGSPLGPSLPWTTTKYASCRIVYRDIEINEKARCSVAALGDVPFALIQIRARDLVSWLAPT
jgi:phosphopantetheine--protein transferase-like protein